MARRSIGDRASHQRKALGMFGIPLPEPVWIGRRVHRTEGDVAPSRDAYFRVACLTRTEPVLASDDAKLRIPLLDQLTHRQRSRIHDDDLERVLEMLRGERGESLDRFSAGVVCRNDDAEDGLGG